MDAQGEAVADIAQPSQHASEIVSAVSAYVEDRAEHFHPGQLLDRHLERDRSHKVAGNVGQAGFAN
jgi:hypothetical protein